jgi:glycosyltransferase involved in cell wall biosynthesis
MNNSYPRIGYAPYSPTLNRPGDKRRFVAYARARNLPFEIAEPGQRYDIVILSELADISYWPDYRDGKVVYDLIDSYLAIPRFDRKQLLRGIVWFASGRHRRLQHDFRAAIVRMCRRADAVVCTTDDQKRDIMAFCSNVHVILDIQDDVAQKIKRDYRAGSPFNLVWEGLPYNLNHLRAMGSGLRKFSQRNPTVLNVVTDPDRPLLFDRFGSVKSIDVAKRFFDQVVFHQWDAATCAAIITGCDLAIIPLVFDDALSVGKPENKLVLLWRMGMPVIASATPTYARALRAAGMEHLACKNETDWLAAFDRMINSEAERRKAGESGLAFASANFSTDNLLSRWDDVFSSIGFNFAKSPT